MYLNITYELLGPETLFDVRWWNEKPFPQSLSLADHFAPPLILWGPTPCISDVVPGLY